MSPCLPQTYATSPTQARLLTAPREERPAAPWDLIHQLDLHPAPPATLHPIHPSGPTPISQAKPSKTPPYPFYSTRLTSPHPAPGHNVSEAP
ncbi:hypothetical protein E2C01_081988 [Portunus trituberculatus]|uniref:Uncharacterized protein n=1 Tax=Portunus trituberculatus TaxID=210409 RepID=A0A5B7IXA5_PORTR|nr:hypothetical protein [Portunus trituberculatus]